MRLRGVVDGAEGSLMFEKLDNSCCKAVHCTSIARPTKAQTKIIKAFLCGCVCCLFRSFLAETSLMNSLLESELSSARDVDVTLAVSWQW